MERVPSEASSKPIGELIREVIREAIRDHHPTCRLVASTSIKAIRGHQGGHQRSSSHLPSRRLHLDQGNQRSSGRQSEIIIPPAVSSPPPRSR